jgi:hypothetical protein
MLKENWQISVKETALENHHFSTQITPMSTLQLHTLTNKNIDIKPNPHQPVTEEEEPVVV